ncbi:DHA2 family efflux MFS transporter permease subunit [Pasteurella oralis]|uniref:DHA2 family efflux MFS transporter permease subunit n=1 Tax=Pasteurella oralis TaxID=1071947 RepID=A0ABW4NRA0_9PAST|nr:DHA2 family efflux MFS transporter permease subunit [Pasteurella oralis]
MTERESYRGLAWIAAIALFMQTLDATILNTALPAISRDLNESPLEMQLAIISYALTVALFIPLSGWLADKYGTLKIFRLAVSIFVFGSITCAISNTLDTLVLSRVLQGVGGALMMPVARLAIIRTVPKQHLLSVWNLMAMSGLLGPILGPILGGWLVTYTTWHWIFLINIPIGTIGVIIAGNYMPNATSPVNKLDWIGFFLFAGGLVGLTLGLDLIAEKTSHKVNALSILTSGVILLVAYYFHAKKSKNSLLPLSLFQIRTFSIGILANLFIRLCGSGIPFLLPLMLQIVFNYSAELSGWLLAPIAISSVLMKPLISRILALLGYKKTLIFTAFLLTLSIASMAFVTVETPTWLLIAALAWYGSCMSVIFTATNTLAVSELSEQNASAGSTILSVAQQMGIGIGIAVCSVILGIYRDNIGEIGNQLQQSFSCTFLSVALFGILLIWILSYLKAKDGASLQQK